MPNNTTYYEGHNKTKHQLISTIAENPYKGMDGHDYYTLEDLEAANDRWLEEHKKIKGAPTETPYYEKIPRRR